MHVIAIYYILGCYILTVIFMVILIHDIYILCRISMRNQWLNSAYYIMFLGIQYILITIYYNIYIYMYGQIIRTSLRPHWNDD